MGTKKDRSERERVQVEWRRVTALCGHLQAPALSRRSDVPFQGGAVLDRAGEILAQKALDYDGATYQLGQEKLLVMWGVPMGMEDAPQRAIRAAFSMQREVAALNEKLQSDTDGAPIVLRIGINTGDVGVRTAKASPWPRFAAGWDTAGIACGVAEFSEPGTVNVTESTFRFAETFFRFEYLGDIRVEAVGQRLNLYRAIAPTTRTTRFDLSAERGLTSLVGRQWHLRSLRESFERVKRGQGEAHHMVGEAGVGKSRLLYEFRKAVANENAFVLEGRCLSYGRHMAYHLLIDLLKAAFGVEPGREDSWLTARVEKILAAIGVDDVSVTPYVLELLSVKDRGLDKFLVSRAAVKLGIAQAMKKILYRSALVRPLILVIEDLHWIDKSSEEILNHLLMSIPEIPVLLITTSRPGFSGSWNSRDAPNGMVLERLSQGDASTMVSHVLHDGAADGDIERLVWEKTAGVPFFIEEFIRSLKDLNLIERRGDSYSLAEQRGPLTVPSSIQDVIIARIDALPDQARKLLLAASVVNREVSYPLISRLEVLQADDLVPSLETLKASDLLYEVGTRPDSTYIFRHALIHDVCYGSIHIQTRRHYHRKIALTIREFLPETMREHPEVLARHFTEGGLWEDAVTCWHRAGEIAIGRSANLEAVRHLDKALELLGKLSDTAERNRKEFDIQTALGPALMAVRGYTAPEVERAFTRSRELCRGLGGTSPLFEVLRGLWGVHMVGARLGAALTLAKQCLALAEEEQKPGLTIWGHYMIGQTATHLGELNVAKEHFEVGRALYDPRKRPTQRALQDPGVACLTYKAPVLWLLGYPDQAFEAAAEGIALARRLSHPFSLAYALCVAAVAAQFGRRFHDTLEYAEEARSLSSKHGMVYWSVVGDALRAWALTQLEGGREAIDRTRTALDAYRAMGSRLMLPYWVALLAEARAREGDVREALRLLDEELAFLESSGERWCEAELQRIKGELLLRASVDNLVTAETWSMKALNSARGQGAKSLELRAAVTLSRIRGQAVREEGSHALLLELYSSFTEGFGTPDLREAEQLLDRMR